MNFKRVKLLLAVVMATSMLAGCASVSSTTETILDETGSLISTIVSSDADTSVTNSSLEDVLDELFTERDMETDYEEEECVQITLSDNNSSCDSTGVSISDNIVTITEEGTYLITGSLSEGQIIVDVEDSEKVRLILDGVEITCSDSAAIYVKSADKVFITLAEGTTNTLTTSGTFVADGDVNVDGVIFAKSDLTLNGNGTLVIDSATAHGIVSKDDLKITSGTYEITAAKSTLSGKDSVRIADGTFTLEAGKKGIQSDGDVIIVDGAIDVTNSYEGIEGQTITMYGGDVSIVASDDGLNAASSDDEETATTATDAETATTDTKTSTTDIETTLLSTADGEMGSAPAGMGEAPDEMGEMPADMGGMDENDEDCLITIAGGTLTIDADGDGIDSNGSIVITGGTVYVEGPTSDGDGALDYNGTATISGGTVVAVGSSGMAQNFSDSSTQGAILVSFSSAQEAGTTVTLTDSDGNVLVSYTPQKAYSSVVISCAGIEDGESYTVSAGRESTEVVMDGLVYGEGGMGAGGPGAMGEMGEMGEQPSGEMGEMPEGGPGEMGEAPGMNGAPDGNDGQTPPELPEGMQGGQGGGQTPPEKR